MSGVSSSSPLPRAVGSGRYTITELVAVTRWGEVFRGHREGCIPTRVVVKRLHDAGVAGDAGWMARLKHLGATQHPNVAGLYEVLHDEGGLFVVSEHVEGESLEEALWRRRGAAFAPAEARRIIAGVAAGLVALKAPHMALRPSHLLLPDAAGASAVKLIGFDQHALQRTIPPTLCGPGPSLRECAHMAPEFIKGKDPGWMAHSCDIWAMGTIWYELLTGEQLYEGEMALAILAKIVLEPILDVEARLAGIDAEAAWIIAGLLSADPGARPALAALAALA